MFPDEDITGPDRRGLVFPNGDFAGLNPQHGSRRVGTVGFDPSLEYSIDNVMLLWQPPSDFSQWSRSEQFMMAEKARLFIDQRAVELIMSSPDPSTHKHIG